MAVTSPSLARCEDTRHHSFCADGDSSFGDIAQFLRANDPLVRGRYRADSFDSAAQQSKSLWTRKDDAVTNEF